jgi:hypothetical protein
MKSWFASIISVAVLAAQGCGGSKSSSDDPNLRRCQASCAVLCAMETCMPCTPDNCISICLGTTDGLEPVCAECVVTNPGHNGGLGSPCTPVFKSTGSAECLPVCTDQGGDAAVN